MLYSMPTKTPLPELLSTLRGFSGSEIFTQWSPLFRNDLLTEGLRYLAAEEQAGCYWLCAIVSGAQHEVKVRSEDFQVWYLAVYEEGGAWVWCEDGNNHPAAVRFEQHIAFTDFPLGTVKGSAPAEGPSTVADHQARRDGAFSFYAARNELGGVTLMLKSEY